MLLAIDSSQDKYQEQAEQLSVKYQIPLTHHLTSSTDFLFQYSSSGLTLLRSDSSEKPLLIDFLSGKSKHRRLYGGGKGQDLAKAIGLQKIKHPTVIDTTAGLGKDAFVLASLGCQIILIERTLPVYLLLQDALERAYQSDDKEIQQIISRMTLLHTDSQQHLEQLSPQDYPDVIYCDPMFPSQEKSAKVKKEMTWFKTLVGKDEDATEVLEMARLRAHKRIVVKRPRKAEFLANKPSFQIVGKSTRYDVYLPL